MRRTRSMRETGLYLFLVPPLIVISALTTGPLIFSIFKSLFQSRLYYRTGDQFIGLGNYLEMLGRSDFWNAIWNTAYLVGVGVTVEIVLGIGIAVLLNTNFPGKRAARTLYLFPMMTTPIVVGLIWRILYNTEWGMVNYFLTLVHLPPLNWLGSASTAMPAIVITDIWLTTPFVAIVLLAGLRSIPANPFDAAKIDGCSKWQAFRYVPLPLLKPFIWIALLFRTMDAFKKFDTLYLMTAGGPGNATEILNLHAYFQAFEYFNLGYSCGLTTLMLAIIVVISTLFIRQIRKAA